MLYSPVLGLALLAFLVIALITVAWLSWRYSSYLRQKRSGSGKPPKPVWKPFWYQ